MFVGTRIGSGQVVTGEPISSSEDFSAFIVRSKKLDGDRSESDSHALFRFWRSKNHDPALIKAHFDLVLAQKNLPMALNQTLARNPDDAVAEGFQAFVTRLGMMRYWEKYSPPDDCELEAGKLTCR